MTYRDIEQCFELTGVNIYGLGRFDATTIGTHNPKLVSFFIWKYRQKETPAITFEEIKDLKIDTDEVGKAIDSFFS